MTTYTCSTKLGAKYKDTFTGVEGHATAVYFNEHGCKEVLLERLVSDEIKGVLLPEPRLEPIDFETDGGQTFDYENDIILGHKYRDKQTGLTGWAAVVQVFHHMTDRVELRSKEVDAEGNPKIVYHSIDDFLLEDLTEPENVVEKRTDKPSPVTRKVERR